MENYRLPSSAVAALKKLRLQGFPLVSYDQGESTVELKLTWKLSRPAKAQKTATTKRVFTSTRKGAESSNWRADCRRSDPPKAAPPVDRSTCRPKPQVRAPSPPRPTEQPPPQVETVMEIAEPTPSEPEPEVPTPTALVAPPEPEYMETETTTPAPPPTAPAAPPSTPPPSPTLSEDQDSFFDAENTDSSAQPDDSSTSYKYKHLLADKYTCSRALSVTNNEDRTAHVFRLHRKPKPGKNTLQEVAYLVYEQAADTLMLFKGPTSKSYTPTPPFWDGYNHHFETGNFPKLKKKDKMHKYIFDKERNITRACPDYITAETTARP